MLAITVRSPLGVLRLRERFAHRLKYCDHGMSVTEVTVSSKITPPHLENNLEQSTISLEKPNRSM